MLLAPRTAGIVPRCVVGALEPGACSLHPRGWSPRPVTPVGNGNCFPHSRGERARAGHPTSPHRHRTLTAITKALRHRTLLPPATITPLGGA
jgi:hypothetical protein